MLATKGKAKFQITHEFWSSNWVDLEDSLTRGIPFKFPEIGVRIVEAVREGKDRGIYVTTRKMNWGREINSAEVNSNGSEASRR